MEKDICRENVHCQSKNEAALIVEMKDICLKTARLNAKTNREVTTTLTPTEMAMAMATATTTVLASVMAMVMGTVAVDTQMEADGLDHLTVTTVSQHQHLCLGGAAV